MSLLIPVIKNKYVSMYLFGVYRSFLHLLRRDGLVVRWRWVNFQCRGVLLIWVLVEQEPTAFALGAGGCCSGIFCSYSAIISLPSPFLWETKGYL